MTRHYQLQKGYQCPECKADVEASGGQEYTVAWRCKSGSCTWSKVQDTYDSDVPEEVTMRESYIKKREKYGDKETPGEE